MATLSADGTALTVTVVVFGTARSGKSAMLRGIHERLGSGRGTVTTDDPARFVPIDWLSLDLGMIGGRQASVLLYAVPGLTAYDPTRRMLLNGADGVIFLADGQAVRLEENVEALRILREHLGARDATGPQDIPMVYFYTKQDLPEELLLPADVLGDALGVGDAPVFAGDAVRGVMVREALQAALTLVLRRHAATPDDTGG